jgi:hypothetical protein
MAKEIWKKIYGQCRMWVNAREITLDPVPFSVDAEDDNDTFITYWMHLGKDEYRVYVSTSDIIGTKIVLGRMWKNEREIVVRA